MTLLPSRLTLFVLFDPAFFLTTPAVTPITDTPPPTDQGNEKARQREDK
jgi:hypothetical protein